MKVLITFDDGTIKVFDNIDRIDHSSYNNVLEFTDFKGEDEKVVDMFQVLKVEVFV